MFFGFDPLYMILALPGLAFALWAQWKVKSTFAQYAQVPTMRRLNGIDAAQVLMRNNNINIDVKRIDGELTDHYDPRDKSMALSDSSVQDSIASVAVVAHELGHAMQDKLNYAPLKLRGAIVPAVQVGGWVGPIMIMVGFWLNSSGLAWLGLLAFGLTAFFAIVTLPVEFDASNRAMKMLESSNILVGDELRGARKVLDAAALTYVAAAAQAILTLLYYIIRVTSLGRRNDD